MTREPVILLKTMGGYPEGTVGTLLTYKDGRQALHLHKMNYGPWKVTPEDMGRKFQRMDYGIQLPIKPPYYTDNAKAGVFRRMLSPTGKVSVYWQATTAATLREAGEALEAQCKQSGWHSLLSRGYTWEPATLIFKNYRH